MKLNSYIDNPSYNLYDSNGKSSEPDSPVRPVVTLKDDVELSGNSNDGWTIN